MTEGLNEGSDALDFSSTGAVDLTASLGSTAAQLVAADLTLTLNATDRIENVFGALMKAIHTAGPTLLIFLITVSISFGQPVITDQPAAQATAPGTTASFQVGARSIQPLA